MICLPSFSKSSQPQEVELIKSLRDPKPLQPRAAWMPKVCGEFVDTVKFFWMVKLYYCVPKGIMIEGNFRNKGV